MTNIKIGNNTENEILNIFHKFHYWAYLTAVKANGQPVDIIAMKGKINMLIDAKHVSSQNISFRFDRVEPNQHMSLKYAKEYAKIDNLGFVIYFERTNEYMWLDYDQLIQMENEGKKSVNKNDLILFEDYLSLIEINKEK